MGRRRKQQREQEKLLQDFASPRSAEEAPPPGWLRFEPDPNPGYMHRWVSEPQPYRSAGLQTATEIPGLRLTRK